MKEVKYTNHLRYRLNLREIPEDSPKQVFDEADEYYHDNATDYNIAVKKIDFKGKFRELAVTYEEKSKTIDLVTIHPIKQNEKENKIKQGRWIRV